MYETLQESFIGQLIYRGSGRRLLKYPEEKPGFELPAKYRRDEKSKSLLASRAKRVAARKEAREQYGKIQKQREEKPIRIAPPEPAPRGGEEAYVDAAERRAIKQEHRHERPVRLGDGEDLESGRRISSGSDTTQVDREEEEILGLGEDEDPNIVTWYGPDDPANPQNWSRFKKFHVTFCICLITIAVYSGSSIISPGIMEIMQEFGVAQVPATLGLSLFVIGYGTGPLLWAPMTEIPAIGRNPPYILTLIVFVVLQVPTALVRNFAGLLVLRFLAGFFGSPPLATGGASLQDMYDVKTRTYALGIWGIAASGGPAIGPVIAGFAAQYKGWRWQFWELLWLSGGALAFLIFLMPETSSQNILVRRAQRLRKLTGDKDLKSEGEIEQSKMTASQAVKMTLVKPLVLNFTEAMVFASNLFIGFVYAVLYSWFESFPLVYAEMYGMSLSISELPFLGLLVGAVVGFCGFALWHKYYWCRKYDRLNGMIQPEERLWPAILGAACLPICLFWFGWSSGRTHWICPTIASGFFGIGAICLFNPIINFLTDGYKPDQTASVLAANDFVRSMIGGAMPLVAHGLFVNLKVDWGCSLLGFISLGFLPLPIILIKLGPWLRERSPNAISPEEIGGS